MTVPIQHHADAFDLRHEDFDDDGTLYEVYEAMRERGRFVHTYTPFLASPPDGASVAIRYEDCVHILRDAQRFSSGAPADGAGFLPGEPVIALDPPRQQQVRRILNPYFTKARIALLEPKVREITDDLIDDLVEAGSGDLALLAWRQPGLVLFALVLGMPVTEVPRYIELTDGALKAADVGTRLSAWNELARHVAEEIADRRDKSKSEGMIDVLLGAQVGAAPMAFEDVLANARLLIQAGLDTTASAMSWAFHYLGTHPEERDRLVAHPDLVATAVDEFVRVGGSLHGLHRLVLEDAEVGGQQFCPGETVVVNFAAANRDPLVFTYPNRVVLDRYDNRHLGFGAGPHRCLGAELARLELRVGLEQVLRRLPDFRIDDDAAVVFRGRSVTRGYYSLPVVFTPGPRLADA